MFPGTSDVGILRSRYRFNSRDQGSSESIDDYLAHLSFLCQHCDYKDGWQWFLRDRFLVGLFNKEAAQHILDKHTHEDLSLETAVSLAKEYTKTFVKVKKEVIEKHDGALSRLLEDPQNISYGAKVAIILECMKYKGTLSSPMCTDEDEMWVFNKLFHFALKNGLAFESPEHFKSTFEDWKFDAFHAKKEGVTRNKSADPLMWELFDYDVNEEYAKSEQEDEQDAYDEVYYPQIETAAPLDDEEAPLKQRSKRLNRKDQKMVDLRRTNLRLPPAKKYMILKSLAEKYEGLVSKAPPMSLYKEAFSMAKNHALKKITIREFKNTFKDWKRLAFRKIEQGIHLDKEDRPFYDMYFKHQQVCPSKEEEENAVVEVGDEAKIAILLEISKRKHVVHKSAPKKERDEAWVEIYAIAKELVRELQTLDQLQEVYCGWRKNALLLKYSEDNKPSQADRLIWDLCIEEPDEDENFSDMDTNEYTPMANNSSYERDVDSSEDELTDYASDDDERKMKRTLNGKRKQPLFLTMEAKKEINQVFEENYEEMFTKYCVYSKGWKRSRLLWRKAYAIAKNNSNPGVMPNLSHFKTWFRSRKNAAFRSIKSGKPLSNEEEIFLELYTKHKEFEKKQANGLIKDFDNPYRRKKGGGRKQAVHISAENKLVLLKERLRLDPEFRTGKREKCTVAMNNLLKVAHNLGVEYPSAKELGALYRNWHNSTKKHISMGIELDEMDCLNMKIYSIRQDRKHECNICHQVFGTYKAMQDHNFADHIRLKKRIRKQSAKKAKEAKVQVEKEEEEEVDEYSEPETNDSSSSDVKPASVNAQRLEEDSLKEYALYCQECDAEFTNFTQMAKHHKDVHKLLVNYRKGEKCKYCSQHHSPKIMLRLHTVKLHPNKPFTCDHCDGLFDDDDTYNRHCLNTHSKAATPLPKNNVCPFCHETFEALGQHLLYVHEEKKNFICHVCNYRHSSRAGITSHIRSAHPKKEDIRMCHLCDYKTSVGANLKVHIEMKHEKKLDYPCNICPLKFYTQKRLEKHVRATHMGIKSYACTECDEKFVYDTGLKRHVAVVHRGQDAFYVCQVCAVSYRQSKSLKKHMITAHGISDPPKTKSQTQTLTPFSSIANLSLAESPDIGPDVGPD